MTRDNTEAEPGRAQADMGTFLELQGIQITPLNNPPYSCDNDLPLRRIGLQEGWDMLEALEVVGMELHEVQVGVVDGPLFEQSPELDLDVMGAGGRARVTGMGEDFITGTPQRNCMGEVVSGGLTHATRVIHIICADMDNGGAVGIASPLRDRLKVLLVNNYTEPTYSRVETAAAGDPTIFEYQGELYSCLTLSNMQRQIEAGSNIINLSTGPARRDGKTRAAAGAFRAFLEKASREHPQVLFVAAAGNEDDALNGRNDWWGHDLPNLITVGALDREGERWESSNYAVSTGEIALSVPGKDVVVGIYPSGNPILAHGTSYAAPQVTAAAALVRSIDPEMTAGEIKDILVSTADTTVDHEGGTMPVPAEMGGRILRIDSAILGAVNGKRARLGLERLGEEDLLALGRIDLVARGGPGRYQVTASIEAVGEMGVTLKLLIDGNCVLAGSDCQVLLEAGSASWTVSKLDTYQPAELRVIRLDNGAGSFLNLVFPGVFPRW